MIPRSTSITDLNVPVPQTTSLTNYNKDFLDQRNSRTLSMRRNNRTTIANFKKTEARSNFFPNSMTNIAKIELNYFLEIFDSNDETKIIQLSDSFEKVASSSPIALTNITNSIDAVTSYGNVYSNAQSENLLISLTKSLTIIFPMFTKEAMIALVDSGISFKIDELLRSENTNLIFLVSKFVTQLSKHSMWARDSLLCYEIHELLLSILLNVNKADPNSELFVNCLTDSLEEMFKRPVESEFASIESITSFVNRIIDLMTSVQFLDSISALLGILASISLLAPSMVSLYFQRNIDTYSMQLLNVPQLTDKSLEVIKNMCTSNVELQNLNRFIEANLFQALVNLIPTENAPKVFWVMSNMFETDLSNKLLNFINVDFITYILDVGNSSPVLVKTEVAYFLSRVILKVNLTYVTMFAESDVIEMLVEMLGCSNLSIIEGCLKALQRITMALLASKGEEAVQSVFGSTDLWKRIEHIAEEQPKQVSEIALALSAKIFG